MNSHLRGAVRKGPLIAVAVLGLVLAFAASRTCLSTGFGHGLWLDECPDGALRQTVQVTSGSLIRGGEGSVTVSVYAAYTTGPPTRSSRRRSRASPRASHSSARRESSR